MVLAAHGQNIGESTLERHARMDPGGTDIGELDAPCPPVRAHRGYPRDDRKTTWTTPSRRPLATAYLDRAVFDPTLAQRARHSLRAAKQQVVVPTRVTAGAVAYHGPIPPGRVLRKSIPLVQTAYESLGSHCVVCWKMGATSRSGRLCFDDSSRVLVPQGLREETDSDQAHCCPSVRQGASPSRFILQLITRVSSESDR